MNILNPEKICEKRFQDTIRSMSAVGGDISSVKRNMNPCIEGCPGPEVITTIRKNSTLAFVFGAVKEKITCPMEETD